MGRDSLTKLQFSSVAFLRVPWAGLALSMGRASACPKHTFHINSQQLRIRCCNVLGEFNPLSAPQSSVCKTGNVVHLFHLDIIGISTFKAKQQRSTQSPQEKLSAIYQLFNDVKKPHETKDDFNKKRLKTYSV